MFLFEPYIFLRDNHPFLAIGIFAFIFSFAFAILVSVADIENYISGTLAGILSVAVIILGILAILPVIDFLFFVIMDLIREGFDRIIPYLFMTLAGILLGFSPISLFSRLNVSRIKKSDLMKHVSAVAQEMDAITLVCFDNGVYLSCDPAPDFSDHKTYFAHSEKEYNSAAGVPLTTWEFYMQNATKIFFQNEPPVKVSALLPGEFSKAFCKINKGYSYTCRTKQMYYVEPDKTTCYESPYRIINGNLVGGPSYITTPGKTRKKILSQVYVITKRR